MPKDAKALRRLKALEGSKLLRLNRGLSRLRFTATHLKHHHPTFSLLLLASECVLKLSALWRMRATLGLACASLQKRDVRPNMSTSAARTAVICTKIGQVWQHDRQVSHGPVRLC